MTEDILDLCLEATVEGKELVIRLKASSEMGAYQIDEVRVSCVDICVGAGLILDKSDDI